MNEKVTARMYETLSGQLTAAGVTHHGVSQTGIDYTDEATAQQRATGDTIFAAFDWEAEAVIAADELEQEQQESAFSRANIIERADDILSDAAAGITACEADIATIATGLAAVPTMSTIQQQRNILTGMLNVLNRIVTRQGKHMLATADITKLVRHLAK